MKCIVTAGPTYEPLDQVRRLTNFSTGTLGTALALSLSQHFSTLLLRSVCATASPVPAAQPHCQVLDFSTPQNLLERLSAQATHEPCALFHAAAVNDFGFGKVYEKLADGALQEIHSTKFSTRLDHPLLAELIPSPKILLQLRALFPNALIVGWKYETDGSPATLLAKAQQQLTQAGSDLCVMNGPAYGKGFGLLSRESSLAFSHLASQEELLLSLTRLTQQYGDRT